MTKEEIYILTEEEFWNSQPPMKNIPDAIREYYELKLSHLTTENTRMKEALKRYEKVSKMIISTPSKSNADKEVLRQWQQTTIQMLESIQPKP